MIMSSQKRVRKADEMGHDHGCCSEQKIKRGLWSPEEDEKLIRFITTHGHMSWSSVPKLAGLQRCGKSCRLRWINYLRPGLKRGSFTAEEEQIIIDVHRILGNRWAQIAKYLPGRTDNEVKNFWNACIKKKLLSHGLDPQTHTLLSSSSSSFSSSSSHWTATSAASCHISASSDIQSHNPNSINFIHMETSTSIPSSSSLVAKAQPKPNITDKTVSTILSNYNYNNHHSHEFSAFPCIGNTSCISSGTNLSRVGLSDNFRAQTWEEEVEAQVAQQKRGLVEIRSEGQVKGSPEMNGSFEGLNFDFSLLDSELTSEFMSTDLSLMDDLAWNFNLDLI